MFKFLSCFLISLFLLSGCYSQKTQNHWTEGIHYSVLKYPIKRPQNEVLEFFWYGCGNCYNAKNAITPWLRTHPEVKFNLEHSFASKRWMFDNSVFYALKELKVQSSIGDDYFNKRHNHFFKSNKDFLNWLQKNNLSIEQIKLTLLKESVKNTRKKYYQIEHEISSLGVPSFLIKGKYIVNLSSLITSGGWNTLPKLLEYLINLK